jgi:hypothetical protein
MKNKAITNSKINRSNLMVEINIPKMKKRKTMKKLINIIIGIIMIIKDI